MAAAVAELDSRVPGSRVEEDLAAVARLLLGSAIARRESRGAHYRTDFPAAAASASSSIVRPAAAATMPLVQAARSRVA